MEQEEFVKLAAELRVMEAVMKGIISVLPDSAKASTAIESQLASVRSSAATIRAKHLGEEGPVLASELIEEEAQRWLRMLARQSPK